MSKIIFLQLIYRGSYVLAFFWLCRVLRLLGRGRWLKFLFWGGLLFLFGWARFREPQQIVIEETRIDIGVDKKVVLISDTHLGVYKDWVRLQRVVNEINKLEDIDMVLIAGDFTYEPTAAQSLVELFQPLADLEVPVYGVLGNHDVEVPGPELRYDLVEALEVHGIMFLHNDVVKFDDFFLVGLGPALSDEDKVALLDDFHVVNNVVVLAHNPDTTLSYRNYNADLTLVGHTHCGQIRLPWIHEWLRPWLYPVEGDFDCGLSREKYTRLFITPGVGEVMLPMRFRVAPTISVIDLGQE